MASQSDSAPSAAEEGEATQEESCLRSQSTVADEESHRQSAEQREQEEDHPQKAKKEDIRRDVRMIAPAPFNDEQTAILERENCDYKNQRITLETARAGLAPRRIRVYADGIYDLFHQGHSRQLMQAKNSFPNVYLIVGVCSDKMTHGSKGKTVMNERERYEAVRHCRYVDEVVKDAPWSLTDDFLDANKIDLVAHDEIPYGSEDADDVYAHIKARGMFLTTQRTEGVSTSDLVARIVKDYDVYVRRNLARGYSAKDMNVSFLNEKKFLALNKIDAFKEKINGLKGDVKNSSLIQMWEAKSAGFIANFLELFGREGQINALWNQSKGRIKRALSPEPSPNGSPATLRRSHDGGHDDLDTDEDEDSQDGLQENHRTIFDSDNERFLARFAGSNTKYSGATEEAAAGASGYGQNGSAASDGSAKKRKTDFSKT